VRETKPHQLLHQLVALDRIDGGFTFLVRIPGFIPVEEASKIKCYSPPRELLQPTTQKHVRTMIEYFAKHVVPHHLQAVEQRRRFSGIVMPMLPAIASPELRYFPLPTAPGTCMYQYDCQVGVVIVSKLTDLDDMKPECNQSEGVVYKHTSCGPCVISSYA
jgi:hypothetical protein